MQYITFYESPIGTLSIWEENASIVRIDFFKAEIAKADVQVEDTPLLEQAIKELKEYFNGLRKSFSLPISAHGTSFQQCVWKALQEIPYGETRSYKQIARAVDNPKGCRAIGLANNRNPIPIIIPCHRVIGANGDLTGFGGGLDVKRKLLELERNGVRE